MIAITPCSPLLFNIFYHKKRLTYFLELKMIGIRCVVNTFKVPREMSTETTVWTANRSRLYIYIHWTPSIIYLGLISIYLYWQNDPKFTEHYIVLYLSIHICVMYETTSFSRTAYVYHSGNIWQLPYPVLFIVYNVYSQQSAAGYIQHNT